MTHVWVVKKHLAITQLRHRVLTAGERMDGSGEFQLPTRNRGFFDRTEISEGRLLSKLRNERRIQSQR
jgi:hypothetical protein